MLRRFAAAVLGLFFLSGSLLALQAVGTIKKVDADKGVVIVHAGGKDRTLKVDKEIKVLDAKGKPLADGLKQRN